MTNNSIFTQDKVEIYTNNIYMLVDEYIDNELDGDKNAVSESFLDMIFYISDRIEKIPNDNIELLDKIFELYVRLCAKYKVLPTLEVFGFLVKISGTTFTNWKNGDYRSNTRHFATVEKWFQTCKAFTVNRLHNKGGTDANLIFIAKAAYRMSETAPTPAAQTENLITHNLDFIPQIDQNNE